MGPFAFLWIIMGFMDPYRSFCVPKDSNASFLVIMGPHPSLWVLKVPYRFRCVPLCPYGSL